MRGVHLPASVARPTFREHEGAIVLVGERVPPVATWKGTVAEYERFYGHTHLRDVVPKRESPPAGSDEEWQLALAMAREWMSRLVASFPAYRFRVYLSRLDEPIVHFHRVRDGERWWFSDEEIEHPVSEGTMAVLDSATWPVTGALGTS